MNARNLVALVVAIALVVAGWHYAGWAGVALAVSAAVMYVLIYLSRMLQVLRRTSNRPTGWVASAEALNARLKPGVNLLHVMALTGSLGEPLSAEGADPEFFRWTEDSGTSVTCEFRQGRLAKWAVERPTAFAPPEP